MVFNRRQSRWLSGCLIVALLFMQLATAAYACARVAPLAQAEMPACEDHMVQDVGTKLPPLCQAHCEPTSQAAGNAPVLDAPSSTPLLLAVLDWRITPALPHAQAHPRRSAPMGTPPPGSPPIYLALLVLRS